ncbi:MAG: Tab2 family RNA-binding protein, partial [Cyanobacteria bacterium P01_H01_bin.15]
ALLGDGWQFGALPAGDLFPAFDERPIPYKTLPTSLEPLSLGLASSTLIPGVIIDGGRNAIRLAHWLAEVDPVSFSAIMSDPSKAGGLVLEAGLVDRWILVTFEDPDVAIAAARFSERQMKALGLHFLLVRPDDSGMTESGLWLLQIADEALGDRLSL